MQSEKSVLATNEYVHAYVQINLSDPLLPSAYIEYLERPGQKSILTSSSYFFKIN